MSSGDAALSAGPPPAGDAGAVEGEGEGRAQPHFLEGIARMFLIFTLIQFATQKFFGSPAPAPGQPLPFQSEGTTKPLGADPTSPGGSVAQQSRVAAGRPTCLWTPGTEMDLSVYFTDAEEFDGSGGGGGAKRKKGKAAGKGGGTVLAEWHESELSLGLLAAAASSPVPAITGHADGDGGGDIEALKPQGNDRAANITVALTDAIRNNETHLYAHVRLTRRRRKLSGDKGNGSEGEGAKEDVLSKTIKMTRHKLRKRERDEKSLLSGGSRKGDDARSDSSKDSSDSSSSVEEVDDPNDTSPLTAAGRNTTHDQILLYVKPSLTLQLVDTTAVPQFPDRRSIPSQFAEHMDWPSNSTAENGYYPILYSSEFWITQANLRAVNGTASTNGDVPLEVRFEDASMWKWQIMSSMESSWRQQAEILGDDDDSGTDMFRTMLLETNPYLLGVTAIVSVLHSVFDFLAFKNDIAFFKGKKSMDGLSVRSMIVNAFFQLVIWLYLADNETSKMILVSNGIGLLIEFWKISRAIRVSFSGGKIQWEATETYAKSTTREYDEIATNHLMYVAMPLVSGYGMYSLMHQTHKGWYSWVLNTLVGYIYMFGFVMMTPQLFINYKLKSVAHLNWRTMTFKSINTFIDDLFAFVIKMPIMHRLACLRDDVIYFVFLYQRWIYRTDYTRVNEYGQAGAEGDKGGDERGGQREEIEAKVTLGELLAQTEGGENRDASGDVAAASEEGPPASEMAEMTTQSSAASTADGVAGTVRRRRGAREKKT